MLNEETEITNVHINIIHIKVLVYFKSRQDFWFQQGLEE